MYVIFTHVVNYSVLTRILKVGIPGIQPREKLDSKLKSWIPASRSWIPYSQDEFSFASNQHLKHLNLDLCIMET